MGQRRSHGTWLLNHILPRLQIRPTQGTDQLSRGINRTPSLQSLPNPIFAALLMEKVCTMGHLADHLLWKNHFETDRTVWVHTLDLADEGNRGVREQVGHTNHSRLAFENRRDKQTLG